MRRRQMIGRRGNGMIESPITAIKKAGRAMSEWELLRACYGKITETDRRGNGGRMMGVRLEVRRLNCVLHVSETGANMWGLR